MPDGHVHQCKPCAYAKIAIWRDARRVRKAEEKRLKHEKLLAETAARTTKRCKDCGAEKALSLFQKSKTSLDGRTNFCSQCVSAYELSWRVANPEKVKANNKRLKFVPIAADVTQICKACGCEKSLTDFHAQRGMKLGVRKACKACIAAAMAADENHKARSKAWPKKNPAAARKNRATRYAKNKDTLNRKRGEHRRKNIEREREREKKYLKENRPAVYAKNARRRAAETQSVPKWLNWLQQAQIQELYEIALARAAQTGEKHHVDHIVPLRGKGVCGLHVPWNLQVLTEIENCRKHNKLPPELSK